MVNINRCHLVVCALRNPQITNLQNISNIHPVCIPMKYLMRESFHFKQEISYPCMAQVDTICLIHKLVAQSLLRNQEKIKKKVLPLLIIRLLYFYEAMLIALKRRVRHIQYYVNCFEIFFFKLQVFLCFSSGSTDLNPEDRTRVCFFREARG